jgi:CubicO group peptidase (beta-lactamase class C family)
MNLKYLITLIVSILTLNASAQLSETRQLQIDSLFIAWNKPNHPGGSIGVMQNDKIIFSKSYGLASLEYLIPNSTGTIFNTGSVSKQFTAMGIVLLHLQGKLSVDDDIRKYLPELHDFGEKITISHMLHHTSGLRSLHAMLELAGWRGDDSRTNEDLNRFMTMQRDLNFKPGSEYLYCNTGYMLMVNIIEKVTGEKFPIWIKENVFRPLGMNNTYLEDKYDNVVSNNATSYYKSQKGDFDRAVEFWGYIGSGNMHSTTNDLLKWLRNFYEPKTIWEKPFELLKTLDKFNDGSDNNYAYGVFVDNYLKHNRIQHGGSIGGFNAWIGTYPNEKLSIAILTNFSSSSVSSKANQIAKLLLPKLEKVNNEIEKENNPIKMTVLSNKQLKKYESNYWNDKENYARKIYLKNDTLRYSRSLTNESPIVPIGNNQFQMLNVAVDLKVKFINNGIEKSMNVTEDNGKPSNFQSFEPTKLTKEELLLYTGEFYSYELETTYVIYLKNDTLSLHHARHGDSKMKIIKKDVLEGEWPLLSAKFKRDKVGKITGILVSNGRVRNLWFEKQK